MDSGAPFAIVLGVAQDGGHPHIGCEQECCRAAWDDTALGHRVACLGLVDPAAGHGWMLDATPDLPAQAMALAEAGGRLAGILLTHGHMGHVLGLAWLGREAIGATSLPVWAPAGLAPALAAGHIWAALEAEGNIEIRPVEAGQRVAMGSLSGTPIPVPHRGGDTVAWHIEGPAASVLYAPDTDCWEGWDPSLEEAVARVDAAFLDGTFFRRGEAPGRDPRAVAHPPVKETLQRLARWPAAERAKVRFTHMNHTNPLLRPNSPERAAVVAAGASLSSAGARHPL